MPFRAWSINGVAWADVDRKAVTDAAEKFAAELLARDVWHTHWRVEIDGCVFKFKVDAYPRFGTERRRLMEEQQRKLGEHV